VEEDDTIIVSFVGVEGGWGGGGASLSSSVERSKGASGESNIASIFACALTLRTARSNSFWDMLFSCRTSCSVGKSLESVLVLVSSDELAFGSLL